MNTKRQPILNPNLRWFLLAMILANIAAQMAYSMLSLYLINLGASVSQVGLVFTVASLVPMALQLFGGWFSDTVGRLRAIAIGSSIAVFGYMLFFISPSWEWVMLGLSVENVSNSFVAPSFAAYIAEQSEEAARGRIYGVSRGIYMVVTVIGPTLAGLLAYRFNFRLMLMVAFGFYALATVVRIWMATAERFKPVRAPQKPTFANLTIQIKAMFALLFAGGILTWIWITDAIGDTTSSLTGELFPIYLSSVGKLSLEQIGFLGSAWGLASILGSFLGGWLSDKRNERTIISAGFLLVTLSLVGMITVDTLIGFTLARALNGLGVGLLMPAYDSLISKVVPENKRGLAFGFFGTSLGILSLPMPWLGAQLWDHIAPQTPFWVTVAACAVTVPIVWFKFILPKNQQNPGNDQEPA
jgi:MFS family permease